MNLGKIFMDHHNSELCMKVDTSYTPSDDWNFTDGHLALRELKPPETNMQNILYPNTCLKGIYHLTLTKHTWQNQLPLHAHQPKLCRSMSSGSRGTLSPAATGGCALPKVQWEPWPETTDSHSSLYILLRIQD